MNIQATPAPATDLRAAFADLAGAAGYCEALDEEYRRRARLRDMHAVLVWAVAVATAVLLVTAIGLLIWTLVTANQASLITSAIKVAGAAVSAVGTFVTGKATLFLVKQRDAMTADVNGLLAKMRTSGCNAPDRPAATWSPF
jgi:hypothetical protein